MVKKFETDMNRLKNDIYKKTFEYQRKYGFEINDSKHPTWNNEADAFKHALMNAYVTLSWNEPIAHATGNLYEQFEPYSSPEAETNMDLWNNQIGREVGVEIKRNLGSDIKYYNMDQLLDIAANMINKKLKNGELITNPSDKRNFHNMKYERLRDSDRVFYKGEYGTLDEKAQDRFSKVYVNQQVDNDYKLPSKDELNKRVLTGDLIYVHDYTRADGTDVRGYYRKHLTK